MSLAYQPDTPLAARPPRRWKRVCPECGVNHDAHRADAEFCCDSCRRTWNNRRMVRGAEIYDLFLALRCDRKTATALGVWKALCRLVQKYRDEDTAQREGRPSWRPAKKVLERHAYLDATVVASKTWRRPGR